MKEMRSYFDPRTGTKGWLQRRSPCYLDCTCFRVCCPACGEPQPNPTGSDLWTLDELRAAESDSDRCNRECVSCDKRLHLLVQKSATVAR